MDVAQNVLRGYLSITFLLDTKDAIINKDRLELELHKIARELDVSANLYAYKEGKRVRVRNLYILTIMGLDKKGILAELSSILSNYKVNIESINTQVRNNWIYNQFILDLNDLEQIEKLRNTIRKVCEKFNLSMVLQQERLYRKNKKLIAFDMDSTLVTGETIIEIAKQMDKEKEMQIATHEAMSSEIDFETSLRQRAKMIQGVSEQTLIEIANDLEVTPGVEELIHHIKQMGWKIAVVSSGFSIFTDTIKEKLDLDYSYGNTLEIINGRVTGEVIGKIIDGKEKWEIITELAQQMDITPEEVVTVGDGSNDRLMLKHSGLGIGLNSKQIASEVADGRVTRDDAEMILLMLGLSDSEIEEILYKKIK